MRPTFPTVMAIGDVVSCLKVSRQYIYALVKQDRLRCQMTSAGKIFLKADILAFKRDRENRARHDPRIRIR